MSNMVHRSTETPDWLLKDMLQGVPRSRHLQVHASYRVVVPPHWEFRNRDNGDFHIVFIKGGEGSYTIGEDIRIPFEKGKIIFVSRGMIHSAAQNTENPPSIIPIRFGIYDNATGEPCDIDIRPFHFSFIPQGSTPFQQLFESLHRHYHGRSDYRQALCGAVLSEILMKCGDEWKETMSEREWDERVEKVKQRIDETPGVRYRPDQLAGMANLSEKYFRNMFKRQYGMTPMNYLTKARLEYAWFLLTESGQSIKQVALSTGYPDPYSFSKQFKQWMGYPPAQVKSKR